MPNVNGKKYPYTAAGIKAAKKAATRKPIDKVLKGLKPLGLDKKMLDKNAAKASVATASGQSARLHQKDLAKISGETAGRAAFRKTMKATEKKVSGIGGKSYKMGSLDKSALASSKAEKKATKSALKTFKKSK